MDPMTLSDAAEARIVQYERNCRDAQRELIKNGVRSRQDIQARFDKRGGLEGLRGIGPKRRLAVQRTIDQGKDQWDRLFPHLPYEDPVAGVSGGEE